MRYIFFKRFLGKTLNLAHSVACPTPIQKLLASNTLFILQTPNLNIQFLSINSFLHSLIIYQAGRLVMQQCVE